MGGKWPKMALNRPKMALNRPKMALNRPKMALNRPKMGGIDRKWAKMTENRSKKGKENENERKRKKKNLKNEFEPLCCKIEPARTMHVKICSTHVDRIVTN
jgi:hypothetical protein